MRINLLSIVIILMLGLVFFPSCQSKTDKVFRDYPRVENPQKVLKEMQTEAKENANEMAGAAEWKTFLTESEAKINELDFSIADLKMKMDKPGQKPDVMNEKRMFSLEMKNKSMKTKLDAYVPGQSNLKNCQTEFNRDVIEFEKSLKVLLSQYSK